MGRNRTDRVAAILLVAIAFYAFLEYNLLLYVEYITDEFLHSSWGADLHFGIRPYTAEHVHVKTQLGILLYSIAYKLCDNMVGILLINRHTALLFVILSLCVVFLLYRQLFAGTHGGLWAVLWTLSCSTFREHSFSIRVDMMATCLALLGLYVFLGLPLRRRALASGLCLGLAFCTTQKSVYFIAAFVLSFWVAYRRTTSHPLKEFLAFALGGLIVFCAYVVAFGYGGNPINVVKGMFFSEKAWRLALTGDYVGLHTFYWHTFSRNIPFYCLSFAGLGYSLGRWGSNRWEQNVLCCFSLTVLGLIAVHREPWPYVFVMIIPFLGCYAGLISDHITEALRISPRVLIVPAAVLLLTVGVQSVLRNYDYAGVQCFPQLAAVRAAEAVLGPQDSYFDGIRMIGTRKHCIPITLQQADLMNLIHSWETGGPAFLDSLRASECKVIIYNYRLAYLPKAFHQFLRDHYVLMDTSVFVSGYRIITSPTEIDLIWPGEYGTLTDGECKNIIIDGRAVDAKKGGIYLAKGKHRVTFEREESFLFLIPVAARQWMERSAGERIIVQLFSNKYDR